MTDTITCPFSGSADDRPAIDINDGRLYDDPWATYAWLRENAPVYWDATNELWVISRHADVSHISRNQELYSAADGVDFFASVSGLYEPPTNFELEDEATGSNAILEAMSGTVLEIGTRAGFSSARRSTSWTSASPTS